MPAFSVGFWLLFAAAMVISAIGFYKYVYFISLGYGFSIAGLGELIFWTGVILSGLSALSGIGQWIMALLGYFGIVFVMFSGARRLELRQNKNYGSDPEYQAYVKSVPILLPYIPLYSVVKYKFLVA